MKKIILPMLSTAILLGAVACNDTSTDATVTTGDSAANSGASTEQTTSNSTIQLDPSVSYIDLTSGSNVKLRVDTVTHYVVNEVTSEPVLFYINPSTSDTFDRSGRLVNDALIKSTDGMWTVDESRLKVKVDDDGDLKAKDGDETKIKVDSDGDVKIKSDGSKEKISGNKVKSKTDTTKTKIKNK